MPNKKPIKSSDSNSMQLTTEQKEKFLAYLERKGLPVPKVSKKETNFIDWFADDLVDKTGNTLEKDKYFDYIFDYAFSNLTDNIDQIHVEEFSKWVSDNNLDLFILTLFSNPEYTKIFILGSVYAYTKLSINLNIEPSSELLAFGDFIFEATV